MVATRRSASNALATTIPAARALRRDRRARQAEAEILGSGSEPIRRLSGSKRARKARAPSATNSEQPEPIVEEPEAQQPRPVSPQSPSPEPASLGMPQIDPPKQWFGFTPKTTAPTNSRPVFMPIETLFPFGTGVPASNPEPAPLRQTSPVVDVHEHIETYAPNPEADSANTRKRIAAIAKVGEVVMAHMNGRAVEREDLQTILEGMLVDPDMRKRLPPVLVKEYDQALQGRQDTAFNNGLMETLINTTKLATGVAAGAYKSRVTRNQVLEAYSQTPPVSTQAQLCGMPTIPVAGPSNPTQGSQAHWGFPRAEDVPGGFSARREPLCHPVMSSKQPLTEANLQRCLSNASGKGKAREERSGVVRSSRGAVRAAPYPRRAVADTHQSQTMVGLTAMSNRKDVLENTGFSVHSASTGIPNNQLDENDLLKAIAGMHDFKKTLDPTTRAGACAKKALAVLEDVKLKSGHNELIDVYEGLHQIICYQLVRSINSDLMSEAFLEHISPPVRSSDEIGKLTAQFKKPQGFVQPPNQLINDPAMGQGEVGFLPYFVHK